MHTRQHGDRYAVGLHRVSTFEQDRSGLGLEAQQARVRAFAAAQRWTLVAEFSDVASAKDDCRPVVAPCAARAAMQRGEIADTVAHRLSIEIAALQAEGLMSHLGLARALTDRGVPTLREGPTWTHKTVARLSARVAQV